MFQINTQDILLNPKTTFHAYSYTLSPIISHHVVPHCQCCKHKIKAVKQNPPLPACLRRLIIYCFSRFNMCSELLMAGGDLEKFAKLRWANFPKKKITRCRLGHALKVQIWASFLSFACSTGAHGRELLKEVSAAATRNHQWAGKTIKNGRENRMPFEDDKPLIHRKLWRSYEQACSH